MPGWSIPQRLFRVKLAKPLRRSDRASVQIASNASVTVKLE